MSCNAVRRFALLAITALVSACGGGGGSDSDSGFTPPGSKMTVTVGQSSLPAGNSTDISVRLTNDGGTPVPNGTTVTASVSPSSVGNVFGVNATGGVTTVPTATTSGGNASFRFIGQNQGAATVTFSANDPNATGRTVTASTTINVTAGQGRLTIEATRDTLPINAFNVDPFVGSPYMAELTITVRDAAGNLVNQPDGVVVSVNPIGNTGGFTTLDDPATEENEFFVRMGQGPVDVVAGRATVFLHSLNFAGTTTVTVTHQGADQQNFQATRTFTIVSNLPPLPAQLSISEPVSPVYIASSGGNSSGQVEILVLDPLSQPVPDPVSGSTAFNNVRVEILGDDLGARLSGINAAGQSVSGTSIAVRTVNGVAAVTVSGAERAGSLQLQATSDRADNNVDNGLSDPVSGQRTIVISDGVLFDLQITRPVVNALFVNPFDEDAEPAADGEIVIPQQPDATYSMTVSIIATDRLGNPVLPGTVINFGLIDEPQVSGLGDFLLSGNNGRPQVGGVNFTALSGAFTTAGGGAGPGDTLVVFGKREGALPFGLDEPPHGYRDLESARQIARVNSATSLDVTRRFNMNDDTGSSVAVPSPGVLPYVIGRATDGNIVASAVTNELGVATTKMTYPVSRLGKVVVVWAQGNGDIVGGSPETVTDADVAVFAGVAPGTLTASPSTIPANTSALVTVCVSDALRVGVAGVGIGAEFQDLGGSGTVEFLGDGPYANVTGEGGCVLAQVTTSGVGDGEPLVVFFGGGDSDEVSIERGDLILQANPSAMFGSGTITLTLLNSSGQPQSGYQLVASCTAEAPTTLQVTSGPGATNASGQTSVNVVATNLNQINAAGSGECEFKTADESASVTVPFQGVDICTLGFSPTPPGC